MPDRHLLDASPGGVPEHRDVQQLVEAESGKGTQGVRRSWQASDSDKVVLTSDSTGVKISRDNGTTAPAQVIVDGTAAGGNLAGTYPNPTLSVATLDAIVPPGTVWAYGGAAAPTGWLLCNGASYPNATYPKLAAVLGTTYGGGGGNFNVPDLQGRVVLGVSGSHARGVPGGAESVLGPAHTHTGSHSHGLAGHTHAGAAHTHTLNGHTHTSAAHVHALGNSHTHGMTNHDHTLNSHTHGAAALGVGGATGTASATNGLYLAGGATATTVGHTHDNGTLDVNGTTDGASGSTSGATNYTGGSATSGGASTNDTSSTTPGATGVPTGTTDTSGATAGTTGVPSPITTSDTDSTAHPAVFTPTTVATMPPFQTLTYIIKTGA